MSVMSDDISNVLPIASQDDRDSHMETNLPNQKDYRQDEIMVEESSFDSKFPPLDNTPVISNEGELLSPFSAFPLVSASPQPMAEEESSKDVPADSQT